MEFISWLIIIVTLCNILSTIHMELYHHSNTHLLTYSRVRHHMLRDEFLIAVFAKRVHRWVDRADWGYVVTKNPSRCLCSCVFWEWVHAYVLPRCLVRTISEHRARARVQPEMIEMLLRPKVAHCLPAMYCGGCELTFLYTTPLYICSIQRHTYISVDTYNQERLLSHFQPH